MVLFSIINKSNLKKFFLIVNLLKYCSNYMINYSFTVLVPGDGGSQVNAKLDKPSVVSSVCYKKTNDFYTIWLSVEQLLPKVINCWVSFFD